MTYYYQRLLGALLGFFVMGPLVTVLVGAGLGVGTTELLIGAVVGAVAGACIAGAVARSTDERRRA